MLSVPNHTIDHPMIYICGNDSAWIDGRLSVDDPDHPLIRYFFGVTRYDLDAPGLRDYLDESDKPATYFYLRRLTRHQLAEVRNHERAGRPASGEVHAFTVGLAKVENLDGCTFAGRVLDPIDEGQAAELENMIGPDAILEIGKAVIRGSVPLTPAEKKRSGS